ncbi:hypothetical protein Hanom_Chr10g00936581 [Helianthus anomalus]
MPAYEAKSHEELRCEDYNFPGKGGFGLSSSTLKWTSPAATFSTASLGTSSIFSTPTPAANSLSVSSLSSGLSPAQSCNGTTGIVGQSSVSQISSSRVTSMENPSPASSPFGTLPPKPHIGSK